MPGDQFGYAVAMGTANLVAVGSPYHNGGYESNYGSVYLYSCVSGSCTFIKEINGNSGAQFGGALSMSSEFLAIGAPGGVLGDNFNAGYVQVYSLCLTASTCPNHPLSTYPQTLSGTIQSGDGYGLAIQTSGGFLIVGSPYGGTGVWEGEAYLYSCTTGSTVPSCTLVTSLISEHPAYGGYFGNSVSVSGSTVVIGAPGEPNGSGGTGNFYIYTCSSSACNPISRLTDPFYPTGYSFGTSAQVSGYGILIGAPNDFYEYTNAGLVYVAIESSGNYNIQEDKADGSPSANELFGTCLSASGTNAIVGAPGKNSNQGTVGLMSNSGGWWYSGVDFLPSNVVSGDNFGSSVSLWSTAFVAGAPGKNGQIGAAYVYFAL